MRILCLNAGSSAVKWSSLQLPAETLLTGGEVGLDGEAELSALLKEAQGVDAVAHRLVHGGPQFRAAVRIEGEVRAALEKLSVIDPLHTPRALAGGRRR